MTKKPFDISLARQDTPGCKHVVHFNNADAALMPVPVMEAVINHIKKEATFGGYEAAEKAHDKIENVYKAVSALIGCQQDEIGGLVNPAAEVGKIAREAGIYYLLDACQSVGQIPVNIKEVKCDIVSFTAEGKDPVRIKISMYPSQIFNPHAWTWNPGH